MDAAVAPHGALGRVDPAELVVADRLGRLAVDGHEDGLVVITGKGIRGASTKYCRGQYCS